MKSEAPWNYYCLEEVICIYSANCSIDPDTAMNEKNTVSNITEIKQRSGTDAAKGPSRRKFLGQVGAALTGSAVLGKAALVSAQ